MKKIKILDKQFKLYIKSKKIKYIIKQLSNELNYDLINKEVIFISVLNGSFIFTSDLLKKIKIKDSKISFLKCQLYNGINSTGEVKQLIGLTENIENKTVVILEDIIDSGITLDFIYTELKKYNPKEIKICTLLFKPEAYTKSIHIDYIGYEIPNNFIVGYGLDYNGYGRNLKNIYKLKTNYEII